MNDEDDIYSESENTGDLLVVSTCY